MQYSFIDQTIYLADTTGNIYAKYNRKSLNEMKRNEEIFQKNIINKLNFAKFSNFIKKKNRERRNFKEKSIVSKFQIYPSRDTR